MYLTRAQAQERIGVSRDKIRKLVRDGELKAHKIGGARNSPLRFTETDIDDYMRRHVVQPHTAATA